MSPGTIALIVVALSVAGWGLFMANIAIRRERKAALASAAGSGGGTATVEAPDQEKSEASTEPEPVKKVPEKKKKPLTNEQLAVSRRQFLNRAWTSSFLVFLGLFGMSSLSFLWPKVLGGFGTEINAGNYDDILEQVGQANAFAPLFIPEGRFWLALYEGTGDAVAYETTFAVDTKLVALYRKCVHLGCSVPHCPTSTLFECPCHGSKYRLNGEYYGGPAPRGLDRFPITLSGSSVMVDTGTVVTGPPRGTNTWDKFAEPSGAFCVPV